ncbi:hypothetical protein D3C73_637130 [compost metagenome]
MVVDRGNEGICARVTDAAFDADRALRGSRREIDGIEKLGHDLFHRQPLQPGKGEQGRIHLAFVQLAQARADRAPEDRQLDIRAKAADERLASERGGADGRTIRQSLQRRRGAADEGIAKILARQVGGDMQSVRQFRRHVLRRMHRDIQLAGGQLFLELLGEQALAADLAQ